MKTLTPSKKILSIVILLAVIIVLGGFMFFARIRNINKEIFLLQENINARTENNLRLKSIEKTLEQTKNNIQKIESYFVGVDGTVSFIETLESLGKKNNVNPRVTTVDVSNDAQIKDDYKEFLKLSINTDGTWANTFYFLAALENVPYKISFNNISINKVGSSDDVTDSKIQSSPKWQGSFDIQVLKLK